MKIVLASRSPRRKKLLKQLGFRFEIDPSSAPERTDYSKEPSIIVQKLAHLKAADVAARHPGSLIIGADTVVYHNYSILEKPSDEVEARQMLQQLSNSKHRVYTGVSLIKTAREGNIHSELTFFEMTEVFFGDPDINDIRAYTATGSPMDKAGAYGIQDDWGAVFIKKIHGDYNNVVGFPLYAFYQHMKTFAPDLIPVFNTDTTY